MAKNVEEDNVRMRKAGCKLAEAASHIIREYDGVHRLALAVAEWYEAMAGEGRRNERYSDVRRTQNQT